MVRTENLRRYLNCRLALTTLYPEEWECYDRYLPPSADSCKWASSLLAGPKYQFVHGKPGSGKSTLLSHLWRTAKVAENSVVLYFYFDKYNRCRLSGLDLMTSFLSQLLFKRPSAFENKYVVSVYEWMGIPSKWSFADLWTLFRAVLQTITDTETICLIDAVDEGDETVQPIISCIMRLHNQIKTSYRFILAGRDPSCANSLLISGLAHVIDLDHHAEMAAEKEKLVQRHMESSGMAATTANSPTAPLEHPILFVHLLIKATEYLDSPLLDDVSDLNGLYSRWISHIDSNISDDDRSWCSIALAWMLFATFPLTANELAVAIALESNAASTDLKEIMEFARKDLANDLRRIFGPLLMIVDDKLYFVHRTLRDFLLDGSAIATLSNDGRLPFNLDTLQDGRKVHSRLAKTCLRLVALDGLEEDQSSVCLPPISDFTSRQRPSKVYTAFLNYAVYHWVTHTRHVQDSDDELIDRVLSFLKDYSLIRRWSRSYCAILEQENGEVEEQSEEDLVQSFWDPESPIEIAVSNSLPKIVEKLLKKEQVSEGLLMKAASARSGAETVRLILQFWLDSDAPDDIPFSDVLKSACSWGFSSTVGVMLEFWKQNKDARGMKLDLAETLMMTVVYGYIGIVRKLLDVGADNGKYDSPVNGYTPLMRACIFGHDLLIEELINRGHDAGACTAPMGGEQLPSSYRTALSVAAEFGHLAAVKSMLTVGKCSVDTGTIESDEHARMSRTPLSLAAQMGHIDIVEELIRCGADVKLPCPTAEAHYTALHYAVQYAVEFTGK